MKAAPRILPLVAVAIGGVLAVKLLSGVGALPQMLSTAQAFAEGVGKPSPKMGADGKPLPATPADAAPAAVAAKPAAVCAPTAAELARQAGLSPAELQVLQSLGTRRGQLDAREQGLETQIALMAAAETKVDAKLAALTAMKAEIAALLGQVDARQQAEVDRMVKVFEGMKPKDSAARFTLLSDDVRLPIAAKMKERALSAMLAQMSPPEAKRLTEALAARFAASQAVANGRTATAPTQVAAAAPAAPAPSKPAAAPSKPAAAPTRTADAATPVPEKPAAKPAPVRRAPKPNRTAAVKPATDPAAKPTATAQAAATPAKPAPAPAAASKPADAGAKPADAPKPTAPAAAKPG